MQVRSGCRCEKSVVQSLKALGLGRIRKKVSLDDNGCTRGLVKKVSHLVTVEESHD
ncbi:MAG: 50S ribosomal protein L30 [Holosporaceae bacterium]|nr:50S ribosomal protein L30 [Holosporaceae bacterium]